MSDLKRPALLSILVVALAACSGGAASATPAPSSAAPSSSPSSAPSESPADFGGVDHATGANDILLRYDQGGGFVMPAFLATSAPIFTLYGDGTIVFRNPSAEPPAAIGDIYPLIPFRIAKLSEDQIQSLLKYALGDGGLGIARASYEEANVADASTAIFTVDAGGIKKTVSVYALGIETQNGADALARAAFQKLAERLADFDQGGTIKTDAYVPAKYRAILMDGAATPEQKAWPWDDLKPADFSFPADPNAFQMATHTLTADQVAKLGLKGIEGGVQGITVQGPDKGKVYTLSLRPLLPDETE